MKATPLALANQNTDGFFSGAEVFEKKKSPVLITDSQLKHTDKETGQEKTEYLYMKCSCLLLEMNFILFSNAQCILIVLQNV